MSLARRALACWRRNQEARRTELRAAARALPDADEVLALPRQRLDHAAGRLPRALRANAQIHRVSVFAARRQAEPQLCCAAIVERRRERYGGFAQRLRASARRQHRSRIARASRASASASPRSPGVPSAPSTTSRPARCARSSAPRKLLAAFSYRGVLAAALRWCATTAAGRCAPPPRSAPGCRSTSNFPTAASARSPATRG